MPLRASPPVWRRHSHPPPCSHPAGRAAAPLPAAALFHSYPLPSTCRHCTHCCRPHMHTPFPHHTLSSHSHSPWQAAKSRSLSLWQRAAVTALDKGPTLGKTQRAPQLAPSTPHWQLAAQLAAQLTAQPTYISSAHSSAHSSAQLIHPWHTSSSMKALLCRACLVRPLIVLKMATLFNSINGRLSQAASECISGGNAQLISSCSTHTPSPALPHASSAGSAVCIWHMRPLIKGTLLIAYANNRTSNEVKLKSAGTCQD